jgi:peptidoglycan/LPS O-acetylase OafA/YrhL
LAGGGTALISPFLAALYIIACKGKGHSPSGNGIVVSIVTFISVISYSIYLVHALVLEVLDWTGIGYSIFYAVMFTVLTLVLSILSYEFIENRLSKRISSSIFDRIGI